MSKNYMKGFIKSSELHQVSLPAVARTAFEKPSSRQATLASFKSQSSSHTGFISMNTFPSLSLVPPISSERREVLENSIILLSITNTSSRDFIVLQLLVGKKDN